ncbi:YhcN/YlaJ family sporulation lipoprotein [Bacillus nakamurai]|uniref:YhcN/YlaJ family sporulation lipoprotein n=1 Tax=Bacillus nakamurai TaxID=1793963 RepID=UPI0020C1BFB9|nr:YhcN/YlaJ family sporulation lipoprotein [Bacillus nakamurai]MCP6682018.1 YhcN/YlaJ family sporulation lipoprotein [Bacillus nakamurai]
MGKKLTTIAGLLVVTASLSACGANNAMNDGRYNHNQTTRPVGYYSNENDIGRRQNGMDHQGPISEMMENRNGRHYTTNNTTNVSDRYAPNDGVPLTTDGTYNGRNVNNPAAMSYNGYDNAENIRTASKIADRVKKVNRVQDAQVIVTDTRVVIAVRTNHPFTKHNDKQVKRAAKKFANGRTIQVFTDNATFTRLRDMNQNSR